MCRTCVETSQTSITKFQGKQKCLGGKGKLTDRMIDKLQNFYRIAIRSNKNNLKAMQAGIRATLFHVASSKENTLHYPH